jgi:hypothetical protein
LQGKPINGRLNLASKGFKRFRKVRKVFLIHLLSNLQVYQYNI